MNKIIKLIVSFLFLFSFGSSLHAMERVVSGESHFGFQEKEENNSFNLQYQGKTILSRSGTKKNWNKYSHKEPMDINTYGCGRTKVSCSSCEKKYYYDDAYIYLTGTGNKYTPVVKEKKDQQYCLSKEMSQIYYISENTGRYFIIGVGIQYRDWSRGYFEEAYLFDTVTKKLLPIGIFSEPSEGPGVKIIEGATAIYVVAGDVMIFDKKMTKVLGYIRATIGSYYGCESYPSDKAKQICVDVEEDYPKNEGYSAVRIDHIELLRNKMTKVYIEGRGTEKKFERTISLKGI